MVKLPHGQRLAKRLFPEGDTHYLVICDHIGDFVIAMGYLDAFMQAHGIESLVVYVTPKMAELARRYTRPGVQIACLDRRRMDWVLYLNTSHHTTEWVQKRHNLWLMETAGHFNDKEFGFILHYPDMTLRSLIQHCCLQLPGDAVFRPFPLKQKTERHGSGRRFILCPSAQVTSLERMSDELFETLADALGRQGYAVYTNLASSDTEKKAVRGTEALRLALDELEEWITCDDCLIGVRSGLMDLAAYLGCRIVCLYPHNTKLKKFYSLDMLPQTRSSYVEYELAGDITRDSETILRLALDSEEKNVCFGGNTSCR